MCSSALKFICSVPRSPGYAPSSRLGACWASQAGLNTAGMIQPSASSENSAAGTPAEPTSAALDPVDPSKCEAIAPAT